MRFFQFLWGWWGSHPPVPPVHLRVLKTTTAGIGRKRTAKDLMVHYGTAFVGTSRSVKDLP